MGDGAHIVAHHQTAHGHGTLDWLGRHVCLGLCRCFFVGCEQGCAQARRGEALARHAKGHGPLAGLLAVLDRDAQARGTELLTVFRHSAQQLGAHLGGRQVDAQTFSGVDHPIEFDLRIELCCALGRLQVDRIAGTHAALPLLFGLDEAGRIAGGDHGERVQILASQRTAEDDQVAAFCWHCDSDAAHIAQDAIEGGLHLLLARAQRQCVGGVGLVLVVQTQSESTRAAVRDVDALGLVGAAGTGLGGDEAVGQLFRAHAQHRHTLARQLAHQLDQVAVACALVAGVARDLDVVGSDDLAHAEDCLNIRLRRVEHPHILGLEVAKGVGRVLGPVEMNRRVWQVLFAAHIELKALLAKLLLKGDAVALVGGHAAALAQRADIALSKRSGDRIGDDAHLLDIGIGIATVHGQQVAAIFGHRHRDLTLAKSRVERDLDQRGLVLAGIARVALSQRLGVKEQGVGCQTGTGHRDPLGRDLANVERRQRTAETDGEGADVAGGVPGH